MSAGTSSTDMSLSDPHALLARGRPKIILMTTLWLTQAIQAARLWLKEHKDTLCSPYVWDPTWHVCGYVLQLCKDTLVPRILARLGVNMGRL